MSFKSLSRRVSSGMVVSGMSTDQLGVLTKKQTWDSLSSVVSHMVREFKIPQDKIDFNGLRIVYGKKQIGLSSGVLSVGHVTLISPKKEKDDGKD